MQDNISYEHLPQHTRELADTALRGPGDKLFAVHAAVLAVASEHLASLISCGREEAGPSAAGLLVVSVLPAEAPPLDEGVLNDATFGAWLKAIYSRDGRPGFEWATIGGVLALADYLGCAGLLQRADEWLCAESRQQEACKCCAAFELAARHRLGGCMALLLPWAVQSMARGSRCAAVWYDGKERCSRLKAAFQDSQLKCLVLDAYWRCREEQTPCATCQCRPADVAASWDTRLEWAAPRHPSHGATAGHCGLGSDVYGRAVRHYAHLLEEAWWACTPVATGVAAPPPGPA